MAALLGEAAAATSGTISLLTMNVAGLPAILQDNDVPGDKATNAGLIGSYFAAYDYDIINVQEVCKTFLRKPIPFLPVVLFLGEKRGRGPSSLLRRFPEDGGIAANKRTQGF